VLFASAGRPAPLRDLDSHHPSHAVKLYHLSHSGCHSSIYTFCSANPRPTDSVFSVGISFGMIRTHTKKLSKPLLYLLRLESLAGSFCGSGCFAVVTSKSVVLDSVWRHIPRIVVVRIAKTEEHEFVLYRLPALPFMPNDGRARQRNLELTLKSVLLAGTADARRNGPTLWL
jgi:hypothetical protein